MIANILMNEQKARSTASNTSPNLGLRYDESSLVPLSTGGIFQWRLRGNGQRTQKHYGCAGCACTYQHQVLRVEASLGYVL